MPEMQHWPGGNDMARDLHAAVTQRTRVSARFLPALPSYGAVTAARGGIVSLWAVLAAVWAVKLPTRPRQARLSPGRSQIGSSPARAFSRFACTEQLRKKPGQLVRLYVAVLEVANTARPPRNQAHDEHPSENLQAPVRSRQGLSKAMSSKLSKATTLALLTGGGTSAAALAWFLLRQRPNDTDNADSPSGDEGLEAGMLLLEQAQDVPGLLPIAFLVSAIVKSSEHSGRSDAICFARRIETLEILLLQASSLPAPLLAQLTAVLEQAEVRVRGGSPAARSFPSLASELQTCVNQLEFEESPLEVDPKALFDGVVFHAADGAEETTTLSSTAVAALIEDSRRAQTADEEQMRLLAEENQLLADQVSQMQKMLAQPTVAPIPRSVGGAPAIGDAANVANVREVVGRQCERPPT